MCERTHCDGNLEMARNPEKGETGAEGDTSVQTKYGKNSCMIGSVCFHPRKGPGGISLT